MSRGLGDVYKRQDDKLMAELGLVGRPAFEPYLAGGRSSDGSEFPVAASIREGAARARAARQNATA